MKYVLKAKRAQALQRSLWAKACKFDSIPTDAGFVCFSKENPFAGPAGRAAILFMNFRKKIAESGGIALVYPARKARQDRPSRLSFSMA